MAIDARGLGILRDDRWLIRDITWQVPAGECVAIVGHNGSGKSTLAKTICGYLYPSKGELTVLGGQFGQSNLNELRESIRLVQATASIDIDTEQSVLEIVTTGFFGSLTLSYHEVTDAMRREATRHAKQMGLGRVLDHPFRTLSSGERVRTWIARALTVRPKLLILDEPTAGLDVVAREQVLVTVQRLDSLKRHRPTIVLITHHLEELPDVTSQVLLLRDGRVVAAGRPRDVLTSKVVSKAYRYPLTVSRRGGRYFMHA